MFGSVFSRLSWILYRRMLLQRSVTGFRAHAFSFVRGDCKFGEFSQILRGCTIVDASLGRFTYVNAGSIVHLCEIGAFCSIGQGVKLGGFGRHPMHVSTHPAFFRPDDQSFPVLNSIPSHVNYEQVSIGNDVWIGDRAMVMGGVAIGTGAVIAAGAVVTKDVGPYEIVGGVPASRIRYRIPQELISRMLATNWWDWEIEKLRETGELIGSQRIEEFLVSCGV